MAIIGKIRKHSALAVIIVGVAIAAFVIGDFGKKRTRSTTDIGSVNGKEIPYIDFNNKVDENLEIQRENQGTDKVTDDMAYTVRQNTWNSMVKSMVLENEYNILGIAVSPEELFEQIQGKNPHRYILQYFRDPKTGVYDPRVILNYLQNLDKLEPKAKSQWLQFEKAIKDDRLEMKFNNLVAKAYYQPKKLAQKEYERQSASLKVRSLSPNFYVIPDSTVVLTDADYQKFYDKNKIYFYNEEPLVDLDYIVFDVKPSAEDRQQIIRDVEGLYRDFQNSSDPLNFVSANSDKKYDTGYVNRGVLPSVIDSAIFNASPGVFYPPVKQENAWIMGKLLATAERPDSMLAYVILVSWADLNVSEKITRTKEQATQRADSLLAVVTANPDRFPEVARLASDYPSAREDGGKVEWFTDGNPNFSLFFQEGLGMKPNECKILNTRIGYTVFKLAEKTKPHKKVKAAICQRDIEPSNKTFQDTYLKASQFAGQFRNPKAFDSGAMVNGLNVRQARSVKEMDNVVAGLPSARNIVRWSYAENTRIGEVSPVFDLTGSYVVAIVRNKFDKGTQSMETMKANLEPSVKNVKKVEMMADRLAGSIKTQQDLGVLALQYNARVDTAVLTFAGMGRSTIAREYEVLGELFTLPVSALEGPLKGNFGAYLVVIDEKKEVPPRDSFSFEQRMKNQEFASRTNNSLFEALKKVSDIKDNRALFY